MSSTPRSTAPPVSTLRHWPAASAPPHELPATLDPTGGPVVVLSPVHGPSHPGVCFIETLPAIDRPLALVTVGMTPVDVARHDDASGALLGNSVGQVTRFYLPGRLSSSELTTAHRWTMNTLMRALRLKPAH